MAWSGAQVSSSCEGCFHVPRSGPHHATLHSMGTGRQAMTVPPPLCAGASIGPVRRYYTTNCSNVFCTSTTQWCAAVSTGVSVSYCSYIVHWHHRAVAPECQNAKLEYIQHMTLCVFKGMLPRITVRCCGTLEPLQPSTDPRPLVKSSHGFMVQTVQPAGCYFGLDKKVSTCNDHITP